MRGFGCESAKRWTTIDKARSTAPASVRNTPRNNSSVEQEAVVLDELLAEVVLIGALLEAHSMEKKLVDAGRRHGHPPYTKHL